MIAAIRRAFVLLDHADRRRWAALVPLAVMVAALEAVGAGAVFMLVRLLANPSDRSPAMLRWLPSGDLQSATLMLAAALAVFYLGRNLCLCAIDYTQERVIQRSAARIAAGLLTRYLYAPYPFHFHRTPAGLTQNVIRSVETVVEAVLGALVHLASEVLVTAALLGLLAITAPGETLGALATIVLLLVPALLVTRRLYARWGRQERALEERLLSDLSQSLDAVKDIIVAGRQPFFTGRFARNRRQQAHFRIRRGSAGAALRLGVETVFVCAMLIAVSMLVVAGRSGGDAVSTLGLFAYVGFRLVPAANRIILNANLLRFGRAYVQPLADDWLALDEGSAPPGAGEWPPFALGLSVTNVSYAYGDKRKEALRGVSLTIPRGQSVGIVGHTGAGKSTLVDLLLGLLRPSAGRVLADGRDIHDALPAWQAQIGYVPQHVTLFDDTLRRNIAFGLEDAEINEARIARVVRAARLDELVASAPDGLDARLGERGIRLSGGERQRVAIARALYRDPAVLVFDEATSALDPQTEREIAEAMSALRGERTIVVIAHRLTTVRQCDRVYMLEAGRLVAQGTFDDLLATSAAFRALAAGTADPGGHSA